MSLGLAYKFLPCRTKMKMCNIPGDKFTMAGITLGNVAKVGVASDFSVPMFTRTV